MSYTVDQILQGIDATTYNQDLDVNNQIVASTVATYMRGVDASNVNVYSVAAVSSSSNFKKGSLASSTQISYSVYIPNTASVGYSSATQAYNATTSSLQASLSTDYFTTTLQQTAFSMGSTSMESVSSNTASPSDPVIAPVSGDDDDDGLSDGAIAGIVIGVIAFVAIVSGAVYWYLNKQTSGEDAPLRRTDVENPAFKESNVDVHL